MGRRFLLLVLASAVGVALGRNSTIDPAGTCLWYGKCGDNPDFTGGTHILNCYDTSKGYPATVEDVKNLEEVCPHFVEDFGPHDPENNPWNLCCDYTQINDIVVNFALPESILERCPHCMNNFRKNFCDLTCR